MVLEEHRGQALHVSRRDFGDNADLNLIQTGIIVFAAEDGHDGALLEQHVLQMMGNIEGDITVDIEAQMLLLLNVALGEDGLDGGLNLGIVVGRSGVLSLPLIGNLLVLKKTKNV